MIRRTSPGRQPLPWLAAPHRMGKKGKKSKSGGKKKVAGTCILGSRGAVVVLPRSMPSLCFSQTVRSSPGFGEQGVTACAAARVRRLRSHGVPAASDGRTSSTLAHHLWSTRVRPRASFQASERPRASFRAGRGPSDYNLGLFRGGTCGRVPPGPAAVPNRCDEAGHYTAR